MTTDPLQLFHDRIKVARPQGNGQFTGKCPAHDDRHPSLRYGPGETQPLVFHCMAGCSQDEVLAALGLTWDDVLGASPNGHHKTATPHGTHQDGRQSVPTMPTQPKAYPTLPLAVEAAERQTRGKHADTWTYHKANGDGHFCIARFDLTKGKTFRPFHRTKRGWVQADPQGKLSLYCLPELLDADTVYGFEGEKCVEAVRKLGLTATTSAHGCQSPHTSDWTPLAGKRVVWLPDADAGGRKYAQTVAGILTSLDPPATVKIVKLTDLEEHGDIVDFIEDRRTDAKDDAAIRIQIEALAAQVPEWKPTSNAGTGNACAPTKALVQTDTALATVEPYRTSQESMTALRTMAETSRKVIELGNTLAVEISLWLDRRGVETLFEKIEHPIPYAAAALKVSVSYFHKLGQIGRVLRCLPVGDNVVTLSKKAILPLSRLLEANPEAIPKALQDANELAKADAEREGRTKPRPVKPKHTTAVVDSLIGPAPKHTPVHRKTDVRSHFAACEGIRKQIFDLADAIADIPTVPADMRALIVKLRKHEWCRQ